MVACCLPLAAQEAGPPEHHVGHHVPIVGSDKDKPAAGETPEVSPRRVEESQPSIYYLKDKQGNLQAVPNFTLEDFEELYKLKHQLVQGDQRPRYSLQQMLATGTVNAAGQAELNIQFRILVREDQWTRIPLRLDQAVLRETAQYQGGGEHFLNFEGDGEGYVAWVRGAAGQQHQLTLKMLVPLTVMGQETRLRLLAPRATASELKLKVPYPKAVARVSEGATLQTPGGGNKETELTVVGLNGDFELSWHPPDAAPGKAAALEAFGNIAARLDGRGVETEATFSVRSYGEAFDRFRIRLPPDTELVPGNASGYTLTAVDAARRLPVRDGSDWWKCSWPSERWGRWKCASRPSVPPTTSAARPARGPRRQLAGTCRLRVPGSGPSMGNDCRQRGRRLAGLVGREPGSPPDRSIAGGLRAGRT